MVIQKLILGIVQGVAEWLPISSEGLIVLVSTNFFSHNWEYQKLIEMALFLHLGTFLAALIYFRNDIQQLLTGLVHWSKTGKENQKTIVFLTTATIISGTVGFLLLRLVETSQQSMSLTGKGLNLLVGMLLLITGALQLKAGKKEGKKKTINLSLATGLVLGMVQGLATLPGLSRSGSTVSALLLLGFQKSLSLKLSFLLSMPIVLAGNILLNLNTINFSVDNLVALTASFAFGLLTINLLLKLAKKINFGLLVIIFGLLTISSLFI